MRAYLWNVFELSINIFQSAIVMQTMKNVLESKRRGKSAIIETVIFTLVLFLELSFVNSIVPFEGLGIIISILIVYIYSLACLKGSVIQKLFWSVFIMLLVIGITALVLNIEALVSTTVIHFSDSEKDQALWEALIKAESDPASSSGGWTFDEKTKLQH